MASLPGGLPSLEELLERIRAPGAARAEVDALIAGLSLPLASEQSPRQRADLLLSLIEDKRVGDFTGSKGRKVRDAAVQALLALGYPYALEVPPEVLQSPAASRTFLLGTRGGQAGLALAGLSALAGTGVLLALDGLRRWNDYHSIFLAFILGTTLAPALLSILGHDLRIRFLHHLGNIGLGLAGLSILLLGAFMLINGTGAFALVPLLTGLAQLLSAVLLYTPKPED